MWNESHTLLSRRQLLNKVSNGFGMVALSALLGQESLGNETSPRTKSALAAKRPDFPARGRRVVWIVLLSWWLPAAELVNSWCRAGGFLVPS